jgi:hypothetical protein
VRRKIRGNTEDFMIGKSRTHLVEIAVIGLPSVNEKSPHGPSRFSTEMYRDLSIFVRQPSGGLWRVWDQLSWAAKRCCEIGRTHKLLLLSV